MPFADAVLRCQRLTTHHRVPLDSQTEDCYDPIEAGSVGETDTVTTPRRAYELTEASPTRRFLPVAPRRVYPLKRRSLTH
ncbi:hypothetical protein HRbin28_02453 [bacterium HR28]|nr:hypothetical protein HRbin28_02453 [bacterium HR28]